MNSKGGNHDFAPAICSGPGVTVALAEIKGPVMERLQGTELLKLIGKDRIFLSTHLAMEALKHAGAEKDFEI